MIDHVAGGGAERLVVDLACRLAAHGHVTLCVTRAAADAAAVERLRAAGVDVLMLGRRSRVEVWRWLPVVRLLRSGSVDVLNTHLDASNAYGSVLSLASGTPLVATVHGSSVYAGALRRQLVRFVGARAAAVVVVSEASRNRLASLGVPRSKLQVIAPAPREADAPSPSSARARALLGVPDDGVPLVGTVCALRQEKRLDVMIAALEQLAHDRAVRLAIVGDGPLRSQVALWAGRLPPGRVVLAGWREDVDEILAAFDVFAISSETEGMPRALIEAMRAGLPIAATAVGGIPEAVPDGDCALHVRPGDARALAAAVGRLLDDRGLARRLGAGAAERARERFGFEHTVDAWRAVLEGAVA